MSSLTANRSNVWVIRLSILLLISAQGLAEVIFEATDGSITQRLLLPEDDDASDSLICRVTVCEVWLRPEQIDNDPEESESTTLEDYYEDLETLEKEQFFNCNPVGDDGKISMYEYEIDELSNVTIEEYFDYLDSGSTSDFFISIPGGEIFNETATVFVPDPDEVTPLVVVDDGGSRRHRALGKKEGDVKVLLIRVIDTVNGIDSGLDPNTFHQTTFTDSVSVKSQFDVCSGGKLNLISLLDAPLDVEVNVDTLNDSRNVVHNTAMENALDIIQEQYMPSASNMADYADLVLYTTPLQKGWIAFAYINGIGSVYGGPFAEYLTIKMHELGHNFGLRHSHELDDQGTPKPYQDYSGVMSGAIGGIHTQPNGPQMCFNAANFGALGWFSDPQYTESVDPNNGESIVPLIGFVYREQSKSYQRILANTQFGSRNLWVHYNVQDSYNIGTHEYANLLTLTHLQTTGSNRGSHLIAALATDQAGDFYTEYSADDSSWWRVEICEIRDDITPRTLIVHMGFATSNSMTFCTDSDGGADSLTDPPTPLPTSSPTSAPLSCSPMNGQCEDTTDCCSSSHTCRTISEGNKQCKPNPSDSSSDIQLKSSDTYYGRTRGQGGNRQLRGVS